jgi:hypothetical protein
MRHSCLSLLVLPLLLTACRESQVANYRIPKENDAPTAQAPAQPAAAGQPGMLDMPIAKAETTRLTWTVPAAWQSKPSSGMRKATLIVADGAELAVTAFPGDVGGELANLNRWRGQVGLPPVSEAEHASAITRVAAGPLLIAVVDLLGGTPDKPVRMLGAMVPNGGSTWFFKLMGPDATVEQAKPTFLAFLETLKVADAPPPVAADTALPSDHPAIGAPVTVPAASDMANTPVIKAAGPGLNWTAPANWQSRTPTAMRKATYAVPGDAGAVGDLAVTAFPGDVGGELANVNRWRGQLGLAPISATEVEGVVTRLTPHGLNVALVDFTGGTADKPVRMLGAIVPFGGATWFFKLTGPVDLVAKEKPAFVAFVQSLSAP